MASSTRGVGPVTEIGTVGSSSSSPEPSSKSSCTIREPCVPRSSPKSQECPHGVSLILSPSPSLLSCLSRTQRTECSRNRDRDSEPQRSEATLVSLRLSEEHAAREPRNSPGTWHLAPQTCLPACASERGRRRPTVAQHAPPTRQPPLWSEARAEANQEPETKNQKREPAQARSRSEMPVCMVTSSAHG